MSNIFPAPLINLGIGRMQYLMFHGQVDGSLKSREKFSRATISEGGFGYLRVNPIGLLNS
jgi:hypothetical protein